MRAQLGLALHEACGNWQPGARVAQASLQAPLRKPRFAHWLSGYQAEALALRAFRKSRLVSHRDNVNPFGASFLNYVTALKLTEVTIDATTFVEMEGSFETDLPVRNSRRVLTVVGDCKFRWSVEPLHMHWELVY